MTQEAVVTRILSESMAEVVDTRGTACGSKCGSCESCIFQSELSAVAKNTIHAKPGQQVVIESKTSKVFKAAALVYIMPIVFFLLGYFIANLLGATEGIAVLISFLFLIASAFTLVLIQKRKSAEQNISFEIIS